MSPFVAPLRHADCLEQCLLSLYSNPREDQDKVITDSWIFGPVLKMVGEFEASVKKYPLIAMGTPDPYTPPR